MYLIQRGVEKKIGKFSTSRVAFDGDTIRILSDIFTLLNIFGALSRLFA